MHMVVRDVIERNESELSVRIRDGPQLTNGECWYSQSIDVILRQKSETTLKQSWSDV